MIACTGGCSVGPKTSVDDTTENQALGGSGKTALKAGNSRHKREADGNAGSWVVSEFGEMTAASANIVQEAPHVRPVFIRKPANCCRIRTSTRFCGMTSSTRPSLQKKKFDMPERYRAPLKPAAE